MSVNLLMKVISKTNYDSIANSFIGYGNDYQTHGKELDALIDRRS